MSKLTHALTSGLARTPRAALTVEAAVTVIMLAMAVDPACAMAPDPRPGTGPGTYTITPNADSIRIPFDLFRKEIRIIGRMNGQEVRMLIDNGALWDELLFFGSPAGSEEALHRSAVLELPVIDAFVDDSV